MRKLLRLLAAFAILVTVRNFENALDAVGLTTLVTRAPALVASFDALILSKWTLAASTLLLGLWIADWLIRRALRVELRRDPLPLTWLSHRVRSVRWGLRHPNTYGRLLDVPFELATLEQSLAHHGFPPFPTIDPTSPLIADTVNYLTVVGTISPASIDDARKRAKAVNDALPPPPPAPPPPARRGGLRASLRRLVGSR